MHYHGGDQQNEQPVGRDVLFFIVRVAEAIVTF